MPRVFLDACVLYPALVRSLLLSMAARGLYTPLWSARVLEEWRRAAARNEAGDDAEAAAARMTAAFPEAAHPANPDLEATITLPDPADAHVLAAAADAQADVILTFNLRDFPARALAAYQMAPRHPDGFLWESLDTHPEAMGQVTSGVLEQFDVPRNRARAALKRARLPRFGKAWEALKAEKQS